jgi:hypothetical protein
VIKGLSIEMRLAYGSWDPSPLSLSLTLSLSRTHTHTHTHLALHPESTNQSEKWKAPTKALDSETE